MPIFNGLEYEMKKQWIRENCSDKFEGIPCQYPHCTCAPSNKEEMERDWRERPTTETA